MHGQTQGLHLHRLGSGLCPGCPLPRLLGLLFLSFLSLAQAALRLCSLFEFLHWHLYKAAAECIWSPA